VAPERLPWMRTGTFVPCAVSMVCSVGAMGLLARLVCCDARKIGSVGSPIRSLKITSLFLYVNNHLY
jgi:hypothetical protein